MSAEAERENIEFFDQKIPGYKKAHEESMESAARLGSKLESIVEKALLGRDFYMGAGGEARKAAAEKTINPNEENEIDLIDDAPYLVESNEESFSETPAATLPEGWKWIEYDDGSGSLESVEGNSFYSYDLNTSYAQHGGIEYKEKPELAWNVFWGSMSEFKAHAESVISERYILYNREKPSLADQIQSASNRSLGEQQTLEVRIKDQNLER